MSAGFHVAPRHGTAAHIALKALHALAGQSAGAQWQVAAAKSLGVKAGSDHWDIIVQALINSGMVFQRNEVFIVSDDGLEWLGVAAEVVPRADPMAAAPRYVPPMRALSAKHLVNVRAMREGAFDYREIPSLHHGERVSFKSSLSVVGADRK